MKNRKPAIGRKSRAFSLIEVMIALGIFFMCVFAILGLVSNVLRNARILQRKTVDAGAVAAELSLTNSITEGLISGDFKEPYKGYSWDADQWELRSNKLFQVDIIVQRSGDGKVESKLSIWRFCPQSPAGSLDGGVGGGLRR